jgi:NADH:ubiquinone oxidoreductase subunit 3 (subunit A)
MFLIILLMSIPLIVGILLALNVLVSITRPDSEKLSPYECGFSPLGDARQQFSVIFYLVALLFLVFDLELLFLFPFGLILYTGNLPAFWVAVIFLVILTVGFVYE